MKYIVFALIGAFIASIWQKRHRKRVKNDMKEWLDFWSKR